MTDYFVSQDGNEVIGIQDGAVRPFKRLGPVIDVESLPVKRKGGRPRKQPDDTGKKSRRCGICGKPGHRREKCPQVLNDLKDVKEVERTQAEEQDLVVDIRNLWIVDGMNAKEVCHQVGISMEEFKRITEKHNMHR